VKNHKPESVLRPGPDGWELWKFPPKSPAAVTASPQTKAIASARNLLLALPARDLLAVPLWVPSEGNPDELCDLELSSRHLLRKGSAVYGIPLESRDSRSLLLALSSADDSAAAEYFAFASTFDASARLWDPGDCDALIWKEFGDLCFAFFQDGKCVFFTSTGETSPGPAFCGTFERMALRLRAEDVLQRLPARLRFIGSFSKEECESLASRLRADWEIVEIPPAPILSAPPAHSAPPAAVQAQKRRTIGRRLLILAGVGGAVYLLVVAALTADFFLRSAALQKLRSEAAELAPEAEAAERVVTEWKEFRAAVDPRTFALDQLAAVAREIPGEQVLLTQFTLEDGRLLVAGEAADVSQAFQFQERVKKSPALQDYDWNPRQPQLAGKNKVRFEMEGTRPDAKTRDE